MLENIEWLGHSSIKISSDKIIYIDPYNIKTALNDADIIFITHSHYDHFSPDDIKKCMNENTKIIITQDLHEQTLQLGFKDKDKDIIKVLPNNEYEIENLTFSTLPAYNINKKYHPKENNWVGYVIKIDNINHYIAGDTDITDEARKVECDIAFLPIGGTFTMDYKEAALLANEIKPKIVIPIHYGTIVGANEDAYNFRTNIQSGVRCEILEPNYNIRKDNKW